MFFSLTALSSSVSTNPNSASSAPREMLRVDQNQSFEEEVPLTSKEEAEKN